MNDDLMTTVEAAAELKLKPATLECWRWAGTGPEYVKINRAVRYKKSKLDEFINRNCFTSTTQQQAA